MRINAASWRNSQRFAVRTTRRCVKAFSSARRNFSNNAAVSVVYNPVKLIECPRDAWQGLKRRIPTELKVRYLGALIAAGFKHIDAVSFVSPKAVPQMADSEKVLQSIHAKADAAGIPVVVYISMAFGNPYGDPWDGNEVHQATKKLTRIGVRSISLADTVGAADADLIGRVVESVMGQCPDYDIGVHLHSAPGEAEAKVLAAYDAGCRRFDSAIGGLGGCPFAQEALVGNIATEKVIEALKQRGAELPPLKPLETLLLATAEMGARFANSVSDD